MTGSKVRDHPIYRDQNLDNSVGSAKRKSWVLEVLCRKKQYKIQIKADCKSKKKVN